MRALKLLGKSRSGCSASQQPLLPRSVWRRPDSVLTAEGVLLLGQAGSPRGVSCSLFPAGSHFCLSAAYFAFPFAGLAGSSGLPVRFCRTFAYRSTISSSTSSLRIAWENATCHRNGHNYHRLQTQVHQLKHDSSQHNESCGKQLHIANGTDHDHGSA